MPKGWFITGTDTGVGKTIVTAALALGLKNRGINVGIMKPIQTGGAQGPGTDCQRLCQAAGVQDPPRLITPYQFTPPLSPLAASRMEGISIRLPVITRASKVLLQKHDVLLVEGIGGLAVPITRRLKVIDMVKALGLPLLLVTRPGLGTLNHTLLTVAYAKSAGVPVQGLIINQIQDRRSGLAEKTTPALLQELCQAPCIGNIPFIRTFQNRRVDFEAVLAKVCRHIRFGMLQGMG